jgi:chemotaxis family two-component system sensor kinase Cph1
VTASPNQVLLKVLAGMRERIESTGASITHCPMPEVAVSELHLTEIFQNLIGNSLKYRGSNALRIHVSAERRDGEWVFTVRDNGLGISADQHEKIFKLFKQVHGREIPGIGFGLAICTRIANHYGGRIWVESEPRRGAAFHVTLPVVAQPKTIARDPV